MGSLVPLITSITTRPPSNFQPTVMVRLICDNSTKQMSFLLHYLPARLLVLKCMQKLQSTVGPVSHSLAANEQRNALIQAVRTPCTLSARQSITWPSLHKFTQFSRAIKNWSKQASAHCPAKQMQLFHEHSQKPVNFDACMAGDLSA